MTLYKYKVIREYPDGTQAKRARTYCCYVTRLEVGGLYTHLGIGFPGMQRVLGVTTEEIPDEEEAV